ncbi:hypothetical protein BB8028_0003g02720 [Beauveria bassiana]|uniref:Uncharacterized protein n=1 Tax=Beauveria bassiana TaxID=176275 RepID=A0A2S7Y631_BEABA|nr:hypothetical protein BB8028_0003g02720 [Beauveria bassiana]
MLPSSMPKTIAGRIARFLSMVYARTCHLPSQPQAEALGPSGSTHPKAKIAKCSSRTNVGVSMQRWSSRVARARTSRPTPSDAPRTEAVSKVKSGFPRWGICILGGFLKYIFPEKHGESHGLLYLPG